jgi:hypothetical protein
MKFNKKQITWIVVLSALFVSAIGSMSSQANSSGSGSSPGMAIIILVVLVALIVIWVYSSKSKQASFLQNLENQAVILDEFTAGKFNDDVGVFITQKGEEIITRISSTILSEFRSSGSTYTGGYGGISFPLFGRVRGNVGGMKGQTSRNPEESTPIDKGTTTFTNQRVVFAGSNMVREFDLDKIVNLELGPNGITLTISVSNREKTSMISGADFGQLAPGLAVSVAVKWHEGSKAKASENAKELAVQIRDTVAAERAKTAKK